MKFLSFPFLLFMSFPLFNNGSENVIDRSNSIFNLNEYETGHFEIIGVSDESLTSYRIYSSDFSNINIDKISDNAFSNCLNMETIMITNQIVSISDNAFSNCSHLNLIQFTGSQEQYENVLNSDYNHSIFSCDEGFINYWNLEIRPSSTSNLCDISKNTYDYALSLYNQLTDEELSFVNNKVDKAGATIKSSLDYLKTYFNEDKSNSNNTKREMNKSTALGLIITASIIGMTSICIFFYFKNKNIID